MDFGLNAEQQELYDAVLMFAREELGGDPRVIDETDGFDRGAWRKAAAFGILGLPVPAEYGGQGRDLLATLIAMEALGRGCPDNGLVFSLNAQMWACQMPIVAYGTEQQKRRWLPGLVSGDVIGAHAITEPGAGSDVFSLTTRAEAADGGYRLTGAKTFSTNGPVADVAVAFAYLERGAGKSRALTAFLVPRDTPGVTFGAPIHKMGLRTSPMGEVVFDGAFLPTDARLGPEGAGGAVFNSAMEWERACIFAGHLGAMERLLESCIKYARERRQFGQPIAKFESVADRIADMKVNIEAGRHLLRLVGWLKQQGKSSALESAIAKLFVSEAHVKACLDALQLHGGYGYLQDYPIERFWRDLRVHSILEGTNQIMRVIVSRDLLRQ